MSYVTQILCVTMSMFLLYRNWMVDSTLKYRKTNKIVLCSRGTRRCFPSFADDIIHAILFVMNNHRSSLINTFEDDDCSKSLRIRLNKYSEVIPVASDFYPWKMMNMLMQQYMMSTRLSGLVGFYWWRNQSPLHAKAFSYILLGG
ncbi:uncharacterized protein LOC110104523 isoform X2 [Dendrobium catenatum]|uniref:uncharacterized protein LOC110104523 isoform X2 n=1 Tax=Dendrobium catenatum TaxID=906689 RepID=UPI0010A003E3|nr:uncharacterized protein LOC110104523 isoform X2 [Dendrobium catenatum]